MAKPNLRPTTTALSAYFPLEDDHVQLGRMGRGQGGMPDIESVFIHVTDYEAFMSFLISDIRGKMLRSCQTG